MSNDISPSAPSLTPAPAAVAASLPVRPAEVAQAKPVETPTPVAESKPDPKEARRTLEEATAHLNQQMSRNSRDLSFSVDDVANKVVVTVKNRISGEVVRQIPSEVALRVAHNLEDMKGLLQDEKS
jgi:flagellar protein FlaG